MDKPRWNDVAAQPGRSTVGDSDLQPDYFMINGLGGFDAMMGQPTP